MRVTSKGQVTIPVKIRDEFGIQPNTEVRFVIRRNQVVLEKSRDKGTMKRPSRGDAIVARMRRVARSATRSSMSTDEIMALTRGD
jgi:AbrB family looped-hinge helix DNA binding protein